MFSDMEVGVSDTSPRAFPRTRPASRAAVAVFMASRGGGQGIALHVQYVLSLPQTRTTRGPQRKNGNRLGRVGGSDHTRGGNTNAWHHLQVPTYFVVCTAWTSAPRRSSAALDRGTRFLLQGWQPRTQFNHGAGWSDGRFGTGSHWQFRRRQRTAANRARPSPWADFAFFGRTDVAGVRGLEHVRAQYRCPSDRVSSPAGSSLSTKTHDVETMFWRWAQEDGEGGWRLAFIPPSPHKDLRRPWIILPLQLYQLQHGAAGGGAPQSASRQAFPVSGRRMNARRWLQVSSPVAVDVRVAGSRPPLS